MDGGPGGRRGGGLFVQRGDQLRRRLSSPGAALDTSPPRRPGPAESTPQTPPATPPWYRRRFRVLAPDSPVPALPVPAPPVPPEPVTPAAPAPPAPTTPGVVAVQAGAGPRPLNAARLLPHLNGVVASRRPVLRWPAIVGARFFNVQLFRLRPGAAPSKVASLFPRTHRVRPPRGRLRRRRALSMARLAVHARRVHRSAARPEPLLGSPRTAVTASIGAGFSQGGKRTRPRSSQGGPRIPG